MIRLTEEARLGILNDYLFDKKESNRLILLDMGAKAQLKKVVDIIKINYPETLFLLEYLKFWHDLLDEAQ